MNTGREVASGRLWMTRRENVQERVRVVLHCGSPDGARHGQLNIYEESLAAGKPPRVVPLHLVHNVQSLNTTHPSVPEMGTSLFRMSMTDSLQPASLWGFMLLLQTGEGVELYAEAREEQQLWIRHLNLLSTYPYSPLPEEPRVCPIKEKFRARLNPANFDADSVWAVYVLPEEVGSRIQALGMQYLVLQSSLSQQATATLKIISPLDMEPIVTWEATKMRRTGNLGSLMFIEVGRRCEGGPGLLWMCTTSADTQSFKETLQRFIFSGDGRPVSVAGSSKQQLFEHQPYSYDRTTMLSRLSSGSSSISSGCSSFGLSSSPPSIPNKSSSSGIYEDTCEYSYATSGVSPSAPPLVNRSSSQPQPGASSSQPISATPPPINLSTHPSKRRHKRCLSNPGDMQTSHPGPFTQQKSTSRDSGFTVESTEMLNFDEITESMSNLISELSSESSEPSVENQERVASPTDLDEMITMLEDLGNNDDVSSLQSTVSSTSSRDSPLVRTYSLPGGSAHVKQKRANSTSTCHPTHYLKMTNPKAALLQDGYVFMQPVHRSSRSSPNQLQEGSTKEITKATPINRRQNYDQLTPIEENSSHEESTSPSNYENHPLPPDVANATPLLFQPTYQNFHLTQLVPETPQPDQVTKDDPLSVEELTANFVDSANHIKGTNKLQTVWDELQNLENVIEGLVKE